MPPQTPHPTAVSHDPLPGSLQRVHPKSLTSFCTIFTCPNKIPNTPSSFLGRGEEGRIHLPVSQSPKQLFSHLPILTDSMVPKILLVKVETKGSREGSDFRGRDQEGQELMGVKVQAGETLKTQEFQTYRVLVNGVGARRLQRNTVDLDQKLSLSLQVRRPSLPMD